MQACRQMGGVLGAGGAQEVGEVTLGAWEGGVRGCCVGQGSPEEYAYVHTRTRAHT